MSKTKSINKLQFAILTILAVFVMCSATWAATYYASPSGGGNGTSCGNAFLISDFWSAASAGDTLYLCDGTYTGANSMITPPSGVTGTRGNPITIAAVNEGNVLIDGEQTRTPVLLGDDDDYFIIEGINAANMGPLTGDGAVAVFHFMGGDNNIIRRCIGWDAPPQRNTSIFLFASGANGNLIEDCAGWGTGRKIVNRYEDSNNVVRRLFFRYGGFGNASGLVWTLGVTTNYRSTGTNITENCIGTWDTTGYAHYAPNVEDAIFGQDGTYAAGGYLYGNLAFFLTNQTGLATSLYSTNSNFVVKDCIAYTDRTGLTNFSLGGNNNRASYLTSIGGSDGAPGDYSISDPDLVANCDNILAYNDTECRPQVGGNTVGAQIKYRYVNGVLTDDELWPWPMNDRIKEAMIQSGYDQKGGLDGKGGIGLTRTVFELGGGTMPPDFTPGTDPDTTPPTAPTNLQAQPVSSSQINLSWDASNDNIGVSGYRIYRDGAQVETSSSTSYQVSGLVPSTTYTYTVSAYDAAGNESDQSNSVSATTQAPVSGEAIIEAESGTLTSTMQTVSDSETSGGLYILATVSSGTVTHSFNIETPGIYKIIARVYASGSDQDSFYVQIDDQGEEIWDLNPAGTPNEFNVWREDVVTKRGIGTYDSPQYDPYTLELTQGSHTITFRGREPNTRLDYFYFSEAVNSPPSSPNALKLIVL